MEFTKRIFIKDKSQLRKEYNLIRNNIHKKNLNNIDLLKEIEKKFIFNLLKIPIFEKLVFSKNRIDNDINEERFYVKIIF